MENTNVPMAKRLIGIGLAIVCLAIGFLVPGSEALSHQGATALGILGALVALWVTSALPLGATALLVVVLCPVLGVVDNLGKAIGGDILEGKQTYLMITAISRADEPTREVLRSTHRSQMPDAEKIATIKAVYDRLDIPRLTEQQISLRFERALGILDTLSVEKSRTERMREYALSLMGRKN